MHIEESPVDLGPGSYEYPFSFEVPTGAPHSLQRRFSGIRVKGRGHITYSLTASLGGITEVEKPLTVIGTLDLNIIPSLRAPIEVFNQKYRCCCCCRQGPITLKLKLPKAGFIPGEQLDLTLWIHNESRKSLKHVSVQLAEVWQYYVAPFGSKAPAHLDNMSVLFDYIGGDVSCFGDCRASRYAAGDERPSGWSRWNLGLATEPTDGDPTNAPESLGRGLNHHQSRLQTLRMKNATVSLLSFGSMMDLN